MTLEFCCAQECSYSLGTIVAAPVGPGPRQYTLNEVVDLFLSNVRLKINYKTGFDVRSNALHFRLTLMASCSKYDNAKQKQKKFWRVLFHCEKHVPECFMLPTPGNVASHSGAV